MRLVAIEVVPLEVRLTDEEILADLLYPEAPRDPQLGSAVAVPRLASSGSTRSAGTGRAR